MSVLDDFRAAEQRIAKRLKELEPAVAEYRELEAVAKRLGIDAAATRPESASVTTPSRRRRSSRAAAAGTTAAATKRNASAKRTPPRSRGSAAPGQRSEQLLELVRARPGITVREVGTELGVDPTSLYRVVKRLEDSGQVRKTGRALEPVAS